MINLQWGGHINGQIDTSLLVDVSGRGDYMEPTAAAQFKRMQAAILRDTGFDLQPAPGSSAYRPLLIQQEFYSERVAYLNGTGPYFPTAAYPGTSNHGWARAIDLNISSLDVAAWAWMQAHAAEYGFSWATGKASGEEWHWECLTEPGTAVASVAGATTIIDRTDDEEMISQDTQNWISAELKRQLLRSTTVNLYRNPAGSVAIADVSKGFWREFASMPDMQTFQALGIFDPDEQLQQVDANTYNGIRSECIKAAEQFLRFAQTGK